MEHLDFFELYKNDKNTPKNLSNTVGKDVKVLLPSLFVKITDEFLNNFSLFKYDIDPTPITRTINYHVLYHCLFGYSQKMSENEAFKDFFLSEFYFFCRNGIIDLNTQNTYECEYNTIKYVLTLSIDDQIKHWDKVRFILNSFSPRLNNEKFIMKGNSLCLLSKENETKGMFKVNTYTSVSPNVFDGKYGYFYWFKKEIRREGKLSDFINDSDYFIDRNRPVNEVFFKSFKYATVYGKSRVIFGFQRFIFPPESLEIKIKDDIDVYEYFNSKYQITLNNELPLAEFICKEQVQYFPVEALYVISFKDTERNDPEISAILNYSPRFSNFITNINDFAKIFKANVHFPYFTLDEAKPQYNAKVLDMPRLKFRSKKNKEFEEYNSKASFFEKGLEMKKYYYILPPKIRYAPLILQQSGFNEEMDHVLQNIEPKILERVKELDINLCYFRQRASRFEKFSECIDNIKSYIKTFGPPPFILILTLDDNPMFYIELKRYLTIDLGIICQFINTKYLLNEKLKDPKFKLNSTYQILAKIGGVPYFISPHSLPLKSTMFVGMCYYHGCFSFTASFDTSFARYYTRVEYSISPEIVELFLADACDKFYSNNEYKPTKCVIYTKNIDLVILKGYVPQIKNHIDKFLIIDVLENNMFLTHFTTRESVSTMGTVLCDPSSPTFFINSTSSPDQQVSLASRYFVLHSEEGTFTDEQILKISFYLCCLNPYAITSLTEPLPVHYASKLAVFAYKILQEKQPNPLLECLPYYI